ncbi:LOW QUALITY PROTEIN: hypothetical protein HID58_048782, partial [Brassica napus]
GDLLYPPHRFWFDVRTSRSDNLRSTPIIFVVLPRKIKPIKRDKQTVNRCSGGRKKVVLSGFIWSFDVLSGLFIVVSGDDMIQKAKRKKQRFRQELQEGSPKKYKPLAGASHAKGLVLELIVQLVKNGKKVAAFVPNDGRGLISGFGRKSHTVGDIPGVRYKVVKVSGVLLSALYKDKKEKPRS